MRNDLFGDRMANEQLGTAEDVARRFGVSVATVNRWVRNGAIPCFRPSRRVVRFDIVAVEHALAKLGRDYSSAGESPCQS